MSLEGWIAPEPGTTNARPKITWRRWLLAAVAGVFVFIFTLGALAFLFSSTAAGVIVSFIVGWSVTGLVAGASGWAQWLGAFGLLFLAEGVAVGILAVLLGMPQRPG